MNTVEELKAAIKQQPSHEFIEQIRRQQETDILVNKIREKEIQFRMLVIPEQLLLYRKTEQELGALYKDLMKMVAE